MERQDSLVHTHKLLQQMILHQFTLSMFYSCKHGLTSFFNTRNLTSFTTDDLTESQQTNMRITKWFKISLVQWFQVILKQILMLHMMMIMEN